MYSTVTEKMAVFTMSNAIISRSGEVSHACYDDCSEDEPSYNCSSDESRECFNETHNESICKYEIERIEDICRD